MAKHTVEVVEGFESRTQLGALVSTDINGGTREIAPAREIVSVFKIGEKHTFGTKKAAEAFAKYHGPKVRYLGKV